MHAPRGSAEHSTIEGGHLGMLLSGALLLAALAGALLYRGLAPSGAVLPTAQAALAPQDPQAAYAEDTLRRTVSLLAEKVGTLQARMAGVDALSRRLAIAAGIPLPDSAGVDAGAVVTGKAAASAAAAMGTEPAAEAISPDGRAVDASPDDRVAGADSVHAHPAGPAQTLGRDIDMLADELAERMGNMQVLDMALTRRRADLARLPTSMPVTDYPYLSSSYGWRLHPVTGRYTRHDGLDFAAPRGTPILAAAGGVVVAAGPDAGYGKRVEVDHGDGLMSRYAHASEVLVKVGDLVERGQLIARVGSSGVSTGPHLHFEVRLAGQALDPRLFLGRPPTAPPAIASAPAPIVR
jgi:murein DD-endopeptidase MepM/ murein hydrolase activator NlpD